MALIHSNREFIEILNEILNAPFSSSNTDFQRGVYLSVVRHHLQLWTVVFDVPFFSLNSVELNMGWWFLGGSCRRRNLGQSRQLQRDTNWHDSLKSAGLSSLPTTERLLPSFQHPWYDSGDKSCPESQIERVEILLHQRPNRQSIIQEKLRKSRTSIVMKSVAVFKAVFC